MPVAVLVRFGVEKETVEAPQLQFFDRGRYFLSPLLTVPLAVLRVSLGGFWIISLFFFAKCQGSAVAASWVWSSFGQGCRRVFRCALR